MIQAVPVRQTLKRHSECEPADGPSLLLSEHPLKDGDSCHIGSQAAIPFSSACEPGQALAVSNSRAILYGCFGARSNTRAMVSRALPGRDPEAARIIRCRLVATLLTASRWVFLLAGFLAVTSTGCSIKKMAVNKVGDALASGGTTFAADDDPDLVKAAVPFSLKLMESLLAESPKHRGLLLASASGFAQYSYAFVQQEADETEERDPAAALALRARAQRLYLRARNYGLRGLEVAHPGFEKALRADPAQALATTRKADVPLLYWTAASWAAAISVSKQNADLIADLPLAQALMDRALALDESYDQGAIHSFLITYEMSRQGGEGDPAARSRRHFERAVALSGGKQAGPYLAYAEAVCLKQQDRAGFESLLRKALAINPDDQPASRLVNLVMQRRARWLLARIDDLILPPVPADGAPATSPDNAKGLE